MKIICNIKDWLGRGQNWVWVLLLAAMILTPFAAAHAQLATSYDAGTILDNAVTYFQGNFGTGLASVGIIVISILLFVGTHRYETLLLAVVAIALYFGGPGLIAKIL
ncbi:MAG TPA: TrbC/VirB2 family protein [Stellaceae bacterium]|nr:TrbC/VirB2 family protein [Stellaceae bacterium]